MVRLLSNATGDLRVADMIIVGNLNLEGQQFPHRVRLSRCLFTGRVVLRHAHFHDVVELEDVTFAGDLDAESARFDSDLRANTIGLASAATKMLGNVVVSGDFTARNVTCTPSTGAKGYVPLSFNSARFGQSLELGGQFDGGIDMISLTVQTSLTISADSRVDGPMKLDTIRAGGSLWLMNVTFNGPVSLISAVVSEQCYLLRSKFNSNFSCLGTTISGYLAADMIECRGRFRFMNTTIGRACNLRHGTFHKGMELDGSDLSGGKFNASASTFVGELRAHGVKFAGSAFGSSQDREITDPGWWTGEGPYWTPGAWFEGGADFVDCVWQTTADFGGKEESDVEATLMPSFGRQGTRCKGTLGFAGCEFHGELDLEDLSTTALRVDCCTLSRRLDVSTVNGLSKLEVTRSSVDQMCFPMPVKECFSVDLQGSAIHTAVGDCAEIMSRLPAQFPIAIHTLEQAVRATGDASSADKLAVLEKRKELERLRANGNFFRYGWSWLYRIVANWGIRPWPLLGVLLLPLAGLFAFASAGAVSLPAPTEASGVRAAPAASVDLSYADAAVVSVDQFLPIDIARSKPYTPTGASAPITPWSTWRVPANVLASAENVAGWLMVPIGLAVIGGMLRRNRG